MPPRIVIVDDNPDILQTTAELLEHSGYETTAVGSASQILPTLRRIRPSLLLQDVYMPDLELGALIRAIRADPAIARTPILLFTASVEGDDIVPQVGADGILRKPFDIDHLKAAVDAHILRVHAG